MEPQLTSSLTTGLFIVGFVIGAKVAETAYKRGVTSGYAQGRELAYTQDSIAKLKTMTGQILDQLNKPAKTRKTKPAKLPVDPTGVPLGLGDLQTTSTR